MFCGHCGIKIQKGTKFCPKCGKPKTQAKKAGAATSDNKNTPQTEKVMKCGNCDYVGSPEEARTTLGKFLAWVCILGAPIITIIYFVSTHKYRCPKCKSTFLGVKNEQGMFVGQRGGETKNSVKILVWFIVGIAVIGIISSVILASLNSAREKARGVTHQGNITINV